MPLCWDLSDIFLMVRLELNTEICSQWIMAGYYSLLLASASMKLGSSICEMPQAQFEKSRMEKMKSTLFGVAYKVPLNSPCPLHHFRGKETEARSG